MSWVAASGCDTNETCEAATSTIVAFARSAMNRWSAGGIALSSVPSRYQHGSVFHAGGPVGAPANAAAAYGRCVAAITVQQTTAVSKGRISDRVRAIIRDGRRAFVGSQSLRRLELEKRREVGVIVTDQVVVRQMEDVFEKDWAQTPSGKKKRKKDEKAEKKELKLAKAS